MNSRLQKIMKSKASTHRLAAAVIVGVVFGALPRVHAHGGLAFDKDVCKLTIGPYKMHFTGFQPDSTATKEFCEDIPRVGRTIIVLDYIDPELRKLPVEFRIIKDTGDESRLDAITTFRKPAKVYPNGSLDVEITFAEPGKFVGFVTAGDGGQHISRFPFEVGRSRVQVYLTAAAMAIAVGAAGLYYVLRRRTGRNSRKTLDVPA